MSSNFFEITEKCIGSAPKFDNTQQWIYELDNPYLHGAYAPTSDEIVVNELEVIGELPDDLFGAFYRNGPNQCLSPKTSITPLMVMGWYMLFISGTVRRLIAIVIFIQLPCSMK